MAETMTADPLLIQVDPHTHTTLLNMMIDELPTFSNRNTRSSEVKFWKLFVKLWRYGEKTFFIEDLELSLMVDLRDKGYSYGDLAYIFERSKASVHGKLEKAPDLIEIANRMENNNR